MNRRDVLRQMAGAGMLAVGGTVLVACGAGGRLAVTPAANRTTMPTTAGTAASTVLGAPTTPRPTASPTATAQTGPLPVVPTSTGSPSAPTPQATAVGLAQVAAVWESVVQGTKGTIVPLLQPTVLPAGIATVRLLSVRPGGFDVDYTGPGKRLRVSVGQLNPPPGVGEVPLVVRGQHVALVLHPADVPEGSDWLTWREPGRWQPAGLASPEPFVEYFVFVQGVGPAEVQQVLASLMTLPFHGPSARPTLPSPVAGTRPDTTIGGISVRMRGAAVLRALGEPPVRTVTHGMGTPEWHYANGLTVRLTDPHNPARPDTVWEIAARRPFPGATTRGFRLGDSAAQFRDLYRGLAITAPHARQLQVVAPDGTSLGILFDESGGATSITFANNHLP